MIQDTGTTRELEVIIDRLAVAEEAEEISRSIALPGDFVSGDDDLSLGLWTINGVC